MLKEVIDLKPCPFCGGEAELLTIGSPPSPKFTISCGRGGCMANISWCLSKDIAIRAWNRRVGRASTDDVKAEDGE